MKKIVVMMPLLLAACGQQNSAGVPTGLVADVNVVPAEVTAAVAWAHARAVSFMASRPPLLTAQMAEESFGRTRIGVMATANICTMVAERLNETSNGSASYSCTGRNLYMDY